MSTTAEAEAESVPRERRSLTIGPEPSSLREWFAQQWRYRGVLSILAQSDFHVRYKRASFGVLWAVAVPAVQAAALALVFSQFVPTDASFGYAAFVIVGVLAWAYFAQTVTDGAVAIVEGSDLADKVWFPRSLLVFVPALANLPGLVISLALFLILVPVLGESYGVHTLMIVPASLVLITFAVALSLVLSALHVYFRDVRYLVQASMLVLFYLTPIVYPQSAVGNLGQVLDFNPLTGIVSLFHIASVGDPGAWSANLGIALAVTFASTIVLVVAAVESHRQHDRLFVDLL